MSQDVIDKLAAMHREMTRRMLDASFEIHMTQEFKSLISPDESVLVMGEARIPIMTYDFVPEEEIYIVDPKAFRDNLIRNKEWLLLIQDTVRRILAKGWRV